MKGVLFDVDGTLTHSDDLHFQAFADLLQKPEWEINGATLPSVATTYPHWYARHRLSSLPGIYL